MYKKVAYNEQLLCCLLFGTAFQAGCFNAFYSAIVYKLFICFFSIICLQWPNIFQMESSYLDIGFVQGLAFTDKKRTHKTRSNVSRSVHCTVVHPGQTSGVTVCWYVFLRHTPCICVILTWLNPMCLVPFQMNSNFI